MSGAGIGPSNEDQGSIDASDESRDHVVASGRDQRHQRPKHDTVAGRFVIADCMTRAAESETGTAGDRGDSARAVSGEVFRSEGETFCREAV